VIDRSALIGNPRAEGDREKARGWKEEEEESTFVPDSLICVRQNEVGEETSSSRFLIPL